jgi:hypothetical protein
MLNIFGQQIMDIDKSSVTKAPAIFTVEPREWGTTIKNKIIESAQAVVFIIPVELKTLLHE